ncbi:MAG: hypothetical protein Tsb005_06400 [Gammaproteobacteria bacterium]
MINGRLSGINEIDDGLAVLVANNAKNLNLLGVTAIFGNNTVDYTYQAAAHLNELLPTYKKFQLIKGAALPLHETHAHHWWKTQPENHTPSNSCLNAATHFMAEKIKASSLKIMLLGLGPATDIACLIEHYPQLHSKIAKIVLLMGRYPHQVLNVANRQGLIDFNYAQDENAALMILKQHAIPLVLIPFKVSSSIFIRSKDIARPKNTNNLSQFLYEITQAWMQQWQKQFGQQGFYPWDLHVINYAINNKAYDCEPMGYKIVPCNRLNNNCIGHEKMYSGSLLAQEKSQLLLSPQYANSNKILVCTQLHKQQQSIFVNRILALYSFYT